MTHTAGMWCGLGFIVIWHVAICFAMCCVACVFVRFYFYGVRCAPNVCENACVSMIDEFSVGAAALFAECGELHYGELRSATRLAHVMHGK